MFTGGLQVGTGTSLPGAAREMCFSSIWVLNSEADFLVDGF